MNTPVVACEAQRQPPWVPCSIQLVRGDLKRARACCFILKLGSLEPRKAKSTLDRNKVHIYVHQQQQHDIESALSLCPLHQNQVFFSCLCLSTGSSSCVLLWWCTAVMSRTAPSFKLFCLSVCVCVFWYLAPCVLFRILYFPFIFCQTRVYISIPHPIRFLGPCLTPPPSVLCLYRRLVCMPSF